MTDYLETFLKRDAETWAVLGHPALLQRFVLRNGKAFTPTGRIGRKGKPKNCFGNAAERVLYERTAIVGGKYVEGYTISKDLPIPIHHAWVTYDGKTAMDPTLNAKGHEYFGVEFDTTTLRKEIVRNKVYGLLDTGIGYNTRLMFEIDPELKEICDKIKAQGNQLEKLRKEKADGCA